MKKDTPELKCRLGDGELCPRGYDACGKVCERLTARKTAWARSVLLSRFPVPEALRTDTRDIAVIGIVYLFVCIVIGVALSGCSTAPVPVSPATSGDVAAVASDAAAVQAACAEAMPYAAAAAFIPIVGTYVAAGVQIGCNTADGLAKLIADPTSAAWLGEELQMLKSALGKT